MTPTSTLDPALLEPPDDATVARALRDFAAAVRRHYGDRLRGLYLFGSRARGDHTPESDADVAVVLADDGWRVWNEKKVLIRLSYDLIIDTGADIQAWPIRESQWQEPERHHNPAFAKAIRRDGKALLP
jgi:predicted nucleotidyltransferase